MSEFDLLSELAGLFRANIPLINLITYEEERVIAAIQAVAPELSLYAWDQADLLAVVHETPEASLPKAELTSDKLLPFLADHLPPNCVVVLTDFHQVWKSRPGPVTRKLRNLAPGLRRNNQFLVMLTPARELPLELKDDVLICDVPPPRTDDLDKLFTSATAQLADEERPSHAVREKLISSALGLTTNQARLAFAQVYAQYGRFDDRGIGHLMLAKRQIIRESGALEFCSTDADATEVGGLDLLKAWLKKRAQAFSEEARRARLPYPRGVALIGVPGTGKSMTAKMTARMWKLPLLRLDVGAIFASLLGESEHNIRRAIQLAETVSPCILWVDEMEKAFAGATGGGSLTGGATARVFGTFLTWMQERQTPVFVIATANDIAALPMELMSRFDRTFFLDLPNDEERQQILRIHLQRAGVDFPARVFALDALVERSRGFVGREIERAVREAQFTAFADNNREIEQGDLETALSEIVPLHTSHRETIEQLQRWRKDGLASPASSPLDQHLQAHTRLIEIG